MNLSQVKIAVGINTDLIKGIITSLYALDVIPSTFEFGSIQIEINEPIVEVRDATTNPRLGLQIIGRFTNGDAAPIDFDVWLRLQPFVRAVSGLSPVAALSVSEVEEANPADIGGLVGTFAVGQINDILQQMDIPIFDSLISGLEHAAFGDDIPNRSTWSTDFYLGNVSEIEHISVGFPRGQPNKPNVSQSEMLPTTPSLIATIALPGESAQIPNNPSIVPNGTGIQIIISRDAMDLVLGFNARSKIGKSVEGATIKSIEVKMHNLGIEIKGSAEKSGATIDWNGIVLLFFRKFYSSNGAIRSWGDDGYIDVFTSGISVDVDTPWYIKLLRVFLFAIGPIGWILDSTLVAPKFDEAEKAPNLIRGAFREEVANALSSMIGNVGGISGDEGIPLMEFGKDSWVLNGHYTHSILAFAGLNRDKISNIRHDSFQVKGAYGESVGLIELESGYTLHPQELGQLLKGGIIEIPNTHGVEANYGFYVRTNPNDDTSDNLVNPEEIHKE